MNILTDKTAQNKQTKEKRLKDLLYIDTSRKIDAQMN